MRKIYTIILLLAYLTASSQENDTIQIAKQKINEIVITATKTKRKVIDIPAQVDVIGEEELQNISINNIDDALRIPANVYVNRSWGIFSKNSSVTMRGLESSARTLVLVDGIPKNKIAGGSVNWHNINPDNVKKIEIIKGPASSLYGNNAMGGVINIITKTPEEKFAGSIKAFYGTYNTLGSSINLSGSEIEEGRGFYWNLNGYYRQGAGYVFEPPAFLDETDVETYLQEFGGSTKLGYFFNESNNIDIVYEYYDELRGAGRLVYTDDGSYETYITNQVKASYNGKIKNATINAVLYYSNEDFYGQNESLNDYSEYKLLDSYAFKSDKGFWSTYSTPILSNNELTLGLELKSGDVDGSELYRTSTDEIYYRSKMDILGVFIQDEYSFWNNKFKLICGLRSDYVTFHDGYQEVINPTKTTGFPESFSENYKSNNWNSISPKIALQYSINNTSKVYTSYSVGFMPPKLKDLSQTGKIRKGFRIANPDLSPETLTNYELGYSKRISDKININTALYYSVGDNFMYMLGNGDSIDTGGSSLKPILIPDNVAKVAISGGEISLAYYINKKLTFNASYSYNYSKISEYKISEINPDIDLTGKYLVEVSPHLFYSGLYYKSKLFNLSVNCNYIDEQWYDELNTIIIDSYFLANLKISKTIKEHYNIYVDIQNIFDNEYVDRKGRLSPGRYSTIGLKLNF